MAGPLSGVGAGVATTPIQSINQSQQNTQNVAQNDDNSAPQPGSQVQDLTAAPAESADVSTQNTDVTAQDEQQFASLPAEDDIDSNAPPGSFVDITV